MEKLKRLLQEVKPYNDFTPTVVVALLAAHYILTHTTNYGFFEVIHVSGYWLSLASSFAIAFVLVQITRQITLRLDYHYPYVRNWKLRASLQFIFGVLLVSFIAIALAYIYFYLANQTQRLPRYLNHDFPIVLAFIILLNAYYFIFFTLRVNRQLFSLALQLNKRQQRQAEELRFKEALLVSPGHDSENPIAFIIRVGREYFVTYFDGSTFLWQQPIKISIALLPANDFFMINPRCIINRMAIATIRPLAHKRFELELTATLQHTPYFQRLVVSQANKLKFKNWLTQTAD